ncbi:MAG: hypothetical protein V1808_04435 [Candidatus Daviesbacteria bacterium]
MLEGTLKNRGLLDINQADAGRRLEQAAKFGHLLFDKAFSDIALAMEKYKLRQVDETAIQDCWRFWGRCFGSFAARQFNYLQIAGKRPRYGQANLSYEYLDQTLKDHVVWYQDEREDNRLTLRFDSGEGSFAFETRGQDLLVFPTRSEGFREMASHNLKLWSATARREICFEGDKEKLKIAKYEEFWNNSQRMSYRPSDITTHEIHLW